MLDLAVAIPTLIGSYLTIISAVFVFLCYALLPFRSHFRHTLVLNLFAAAFIDGLNKTISGTYALQNGRIPPGSLCTLNGAIGHLTDQVMDFSILGIAFATFFVIRRRSYTALSVSPARRLLMFIAIWNIPVITTLIAINLGAFEPTDNNWCWIKQSSTSLRYELGHAWRMLIIFTVLVIYSYLFFYVHRHFDYLRAMHIESSSVISSHWSIYSADSVNILDAFEEFTIYDSEDPIVTTFQDSFPPNPTINTESKNIVANATSVYPRTTDGTPINRPPKPAPITSPILPTNFDTRDPQALIRQPLPTPTINYPTKSTLDAREGSTIKKILFNSYPIPYIILLLPYLFSRAAEVLHIDQRSVKIMESSWAYVGVVSAVVFVFNERIFARFQESRWLKRSEQMNKISISLPVFDDRRSG